MELQELIDNIIGATKHESLILLDSYNINYRVIREDETNNIVTMDLRSDRLNLEFDKNIVTKCYIG